MSDARTRRRRGRPPNAEGAQTRSRLLEAALELFARQGYAATSVREIAEKVGVRDSAIYGHFAGKRAIYEALIEDTGPGLLRRVGVGLDHLAEMAPSEALPLLVDELIDAWDQRRTRLATSLLIREELAGVGPALSEVQERLLPTFAKWQAQGQIRTDIAAGMLAWELISPLAISRLLFLHGQASTPDRRRGRELASAHVEYFLSTLAPRSQTSPTSKGKST